MLHNSNNVDNNKNANQNSIDPLAFNATPNNFDWSAQVNLSPYLNRPPNTHVKTLAGSSSPALTRQSLGFLSNNTTGTQKQTMYCSAT